METDSIRCNLCFFISPILLLPPIFYFQRYPFLISFLPKTMDQKEIVARVRAKIAPTHKDVAKINGDSTK